jgi:hypothetical protein
MLRETRRLTFLGIIWLIGFLAMIWTPTVAIEHPVSPSITLEVRLRPPSAIADILRRGCYDCHSNSINWPWYAHVWPLSSKIGHDVAEGRRVLNFSEWTRATKDDKGLEARTLATSCSLMQAGMMPPPYYLYVHAGSRLSNNDVHRFCEWARQESIRLQNQATTR